MKVEVKQLEDLVRELSVEVPSETVNDKIDGKLKDIQRNASIKGFRKGKAPMNMIKSMYGEQAKIDAAEDIIKATYPQAVREKTLQVASYPTVTDFSFTDDGGFAYKAKVEVFPEVGKVDYADLKLEADEIEVKDEEVDEVIEALRKRHSELREVTREAGGTDVVSLDIEVVSDPGKVLKTDRFPDSEVDLGNKLTVKEFKEQIPGMKAGDVKEIDVTYADDYPDETFAGAKLTYRCHVKAVKERILPILSDQFARTVGEGETLLELRMKVRKELERRKTDDRNRMFKGQIIQQVCDKNQVPIPRAMLSEYLDNVVKNFKGRHSDVNEEELRKNYEPIGATNIRWNMLMHHLAKQESIEVLPSDTENLINRFAENYKMTPEQAREALQKSGNIADMRESILEDKVIDFLVSRANISKPGK
ncbi:MAG: trigger factor [Candidatus Zixiibacteriota bacterium]|nr:MAG: trigger factor [candidate division Zixibacteria bacterium]